MERIDLSRLIDFINSAVEDEEFIHVITYYKLPNTVPCCMGGIDLFDCLSDKSPLYSTFKPHNNIPKTLCRIEMYTQKEAINIQIGTIQNLSTILSNEIDKNKHFDYFDINKYQLKGNIVVTTDITDSLNYVYFNYNDGDLVFDSVDELSKYWMDIKDIIHSIGQKRMEKKLI